jgi:hypothetical protein
MNDDAFESITHRLGQTAAWRRNLARKFPDDPRNGRAAARLDSLSQSNGSDIQADTWAALEPYFETQKLHDAVSEAGRDVGFRSRPAGLDHFLSTVAVRLGGVN